MKGHALGRRLLGKAATIVTPDTILHWHNKLIAMKWTFAKKRTGRPGIIKEIRKLIIMMATNNSSWGYARIQGELKKLNHNVARTTIANTPKAHGIPPSTQRPTTWKSFLKTHADVICATDFFTTEVWTERGLVTHYTLFMINIATRAVLIAGPTLNPNAKFTAQVARNLTDHIDGFLRDKRHLILDRDALFTAQFKRILKDAEVNVVRTAYRTPSMNVFAERWVRSIKSECLSKIIPFGSKSLERAVSEYTALTISTVLIRA